MVSERYTLASSLVSTVPLSTAAVNFSCVPRLMIRGVNATVASDIDDTDLGLSCFLVGQSVLPQPLNRNAQVLIEYQRSILTQFLIPYALFL
jgi:hypothetical protein